MHFYTSTYIFNAGDDWTSVGSFVVSDAYGWGITPTAASGWIFSATQLWCRNP